MRDVVNIDLNKGLSRTYAGMVLATGDNMANCFGAALYRGGEAVDITGYAVTGYFIRKSGAETVVIVGKAEGNEAIVELPQACYAFDGNFSLAIKVSGADVTATVRVVDGAIRLTQTGVMIDPGDVVPSLDELFAQIAAMEAATAEANAAAAAADAAREGIQGDLAAISDRIGVYDKYVGATPVVKDEAGTEVLTLTATNGEMSYNTNGTLKFGTQTYWQNGYIEVTPGEMYEVQALFGQTKQSEYVAAVDDNMLVLGKWLPNTEKLNYALSEYQTITIPEGATRLYICGFYPTTSKFVSEIKPKRITNTYYGSHAEAIREALDSTAANTAKIAELNDKAEDNSGEIAELSAVAGRKSTFADIGLTGTYGYLQSNTSVNSTLTKNRAVFDYLMLPAGAVIELVAGDYTLSGVGAYLYDRDMTYLSELGNANSAKQIAIPVDCYARVQVAVAGVDSADGLHSEIGKQILLSFPTYSGIQNSVLRAFHAIPVAMEIGSTDNGKPTSSTTRCRSTERIVLGKGTTFLCPEVGAGWRFELVMFDLCTDAYIGSTGWKQCEYTADRDCKALVVMHRNNTTLTEEDLANAPGKLLMSYMPPMGYLQNVSVRDMELPDYYHADGYMDGRLDTIRSHEDACSFNGDGFIFLTDYHRATSYLRSPALVRHIVNRTSIKRMIFGGDAITEYSDKDVAKEEMWLARRDFDFLTGDKYLAVIGNHELNNAGGSESKAAQQLSASEAYAYVAKENEDIYTVLDEYAYCWDNKSQQIRYYLIGCNYTSLILPDTISKVLASFGQIPDGYSIVVVSHAGIKDSAAELDSRFAVIAAGMDALKNKTAYEYNGQTYDYSGKNVDVICAITGHRHVDGHVVSAGGTLVIATTSDTPNEASISTLTRTRNTTTESAFDVVQIDKAGRKVYLTRIGAGEDREFSY